MTVKLFIICHYDVSILTVFSLFSDQNLQSCEDSPYGCCADMKTAAPGNNYAGCPGKYVTWGDGREKGWGHG